MLAFQTPSILDVDWSIWREGELVTAGDMTDYRYIDESPRDVPAQIGYALFGLPVNRNEAHYRSFGLRGSFTWARGVGAANLEAGEAYTLRVDIGREFPDLQIANPHLDVRFNRRSFLEQRSGIVIQGFLGLALTGIALLIAAAAWLRKRQSMPPDLIRHRNLKHNERLSRRYKYLPYAGDMSLFLPDRHADVMGATVSSWRQVIEGELSVDVIEGAHLHMQLVDAVHGPILARRFAQRLAEHTSPS